MSSFGRNATLNFGPVTLSIAPAPIRRNLSVEANVVSFVLLSSVTLMLALYFRFWLGRYMFLVIALVALSQFAYIAIAIRRFYLQSGRWSGRLLSVAAAMLIYLLNSVFMTAVQLAGTAISLALA